MSDSCGPGQCVSISSRSLPRTDEDGWYMWTYKYTGKAAMFTVKVPAYSVEKSVTLKANGYLVVSFTV